MKVLSVSSSKWWSQFPCQFSFLSHYSIECDSAQMLASVVPDMATGLAENMDDSRPSPL